jgi:plastocyanin
VHLLFGTTTQTWGEPRNFQQWRIPLAGSSVSALMKSQYRLGGAVLLVMFLVGGMALPLCAGTLSGNIKATHGDSIIYLAPLHPLEFARPQQIYTIHQKSMQFVPRVLVVPQGATVEFPNEDIAPHNVYWKSIGGNPRLAHDLGIVGRGHKASWIFTHPGDVLILCSFHREMSAHIIVAPSPYFAKADAILGDYFISGVPDGKYRVNVWHNGTVTSKLITVAGDTQASFTLTH